MSGMQRERSGRVPDIELPCLLPVESGHVISMCSPNKKLFQLWVSRDLLASHYITGHMTVLSVDPLPSQTSGLSGLIARYQRAHLEAPH